MGYGIGALWDLYNRSTEWQTVVVGCGVGEWGWGWPSYQQGSLLKIINRWKDWWIQMERWRIGTARADGWMDRQAEPLIVAASSAIWSVRKFLPSVKCNIKRYRDEIIVFVNLKNCGCHWSSPVMWERKWDWVSVREREKNLFDIMLLFELMVTYLLITPPETFFDWISIKFEHCHLQILFAIYVGPSVLKYW